MIIGLRWAQWLLALAGCAINTYTLATAVLTFLEVRYRRVNGYYRVLSIGGMLQEASRFVVQLLLFLIATGFLGRGFPPGRPAGVVIFIVMSLMTMLSSVSSWVTRRKVIATRKHERDS